LNLLNHPRLSRVLGLKIAASAILPEDFLHSERCHLIIGLQVRFKMMDFASIPVPENFWSICYVLETSPPFCSFQTILIKNNFKYEKLFA